MLTKWTTRSRRVKCDEHHPACQRCIAGGRTCEGYAQPNTLNVPRRQESRAGSQSSQPGRSSRPNSPDTGSPLSNDEESPFQTYQPRSGAETTGYFASDFWSQLVHRVGGDEPAVQYALSALGAAHSASFEDSTQESESSQSYRPPEIERSSNRLAIQHYTEAIGHLQVVFDSNRSDATEIILVCCFLFVCIECLFGHPTAAVNHAKAGIKVQGEWLAQGGPFKDETTSSSTGPNNVDYCIWRLCSEFESQVWLLTDGQSPITPAARWEELPYSVYYSLRDFSTIDQAQLSLDTIAKRLFFLVHENTQSQKDFDPTVPQTTLKEHQVIGRLLEEFQAPFGRLVSTIQAREPDRPILLLEMQHLTLTVMHSNLFNSGSVDQSTEEFLEIVNIGEKILKLHPSLPQSPNPLPGTSREHILESTIDPSLSSREPPLTASRRTSKTEGSFLAVYARRAPSFTLATGIIPPLYFTTQACTSVPIRQKAIALLYAANCVEGIWSSQSAAKVAEEDLKADMTGAQRRPNPGLMPLGRMLGVVGWRNDQDPIVTSEAQPASSVYM